MKKTQEKPEWLEARNLKTREDLWLKLDKDIFAGKCSLTEHTIDGVRVLRLGVSPAIDRDPPLSFAVTETEMDGFDQPGEFKDTDLPLNLFFKQIAEDHFRIGFDLPEKSQCFALGERLSDVNLRGRRHTLFNYSDNLHIPSLDTMYVSIPFLVVADLHRSQYHGILLDSPAWQSWSLDEELNDRGVVDLLSRRGWTIYMMEADCLPDLIASYTALTGRSKIPPDWALGHHQSRWSYPDQETLLAVGKKMRESEIPCDCLVLDIDYMDEYRVFTHSKERFPDFKQVVDELDSLGLKTTCILDPGVKKEEKFSVYADGKKRDFFVRRGDQRPFLGKVWPGPSVFPDFLRHDVRVWWSAQHGFFVDNNIAGVWNDMNEPCLIDSPCPMPPQSKELPPEDKQMFMQALPEGKVGHYEVRNLYGFQMARASFEGLLALRPDERPFVLTRSGYAGVQRYSAVWLGDNMSWWEHLALSIPMLINMGLSGVPFTGVDVGGFGDNCSAELLTRWYELGIFYPFFRNHSSMLGVVQEPWVFGDKTEARIRHLVGMRYRLLPYIKRLFFEHARNGAPLIRPLFWSYPDDQEVYDIDDQFLFGDDIMVAPVTKRGHRSRVVYFPRGKWIPLEGGAVIEGGRYLRVELELGTVPAFARVGSIIPTVPVIQSTREYQQAPVIFKCFGDGIGLFIEDDGISFEYENDGYNEWLLTVLDGKPKVECVNYGYIAPERKYYLDLNGVVTELRLQSPT
ncbi:MAG: glycoside hydrolase family 31 protein [Cyanobacteriota/Melainabacteria group bacterium]